MKSAVRQFPSHTFSPAKRHYSETLLRKDSFHRERFTTRSHGRTTCSVRGIRTISAFAYRGCDNTIRRVSSKKRQEGSRSAERISSSRVDGGGSSPGEKNGSASVALGGGIWALGQFDPTPESAQIWVSRYSLFTYKSSNSKYYGC